MTIEYLIQTYGYVAILVGTFLEGETVLVLGGLAAHQGYLQLPGVMLAAFAGTLIGDQLFFFLGLILFSGCIFFLLVELFFFSVGFFGCCYGFGYALEEACWGFGEVFLFVSQQVSCSQNFKRVHG